MTQTSVRDALAARQVSRREFLKFCSTVAAALMLPSTAAGKIAMQLESPKRTPLIWLEFQDCAGNSEAFLRASRPTAAEIILDILSIDYQETIMAAAGYRAEEAKKKTIDAGGYLLVVEGSIPTGEDGAFCCIGGRSAVDILAEAAANAVAVIAIGSCAAFGGLPKASPNPTSAKSVMELVKDKPVLNLPGCPCNAVNLTATVVHFLTFGTLPEMDVQHRPLFAYGARIHDNCPRRGHFDASEFVLTWGDAGHRAGWCLYKMGCKGPVTFHNCPAVGYNDNTSWPIKAGHGCIGCSEDNFWDFGLYNTANLQKFAPPTAYAPVQPQVETIAPTNAALLGGLAGLAIGAAGAAAITQLSKKDQPVESSQVTSDDLK